MRIIVSRLYEGQVCKADRLQLIHTHDLDLNDRETLAEITTINPTLDNAISHDIASNGQAITENMDASLGGTDAQEACKLLLVSSLANVPHAVVGLSLSEIVAYLCAPGRDLTKLREILGILSTKAWYLHSNREGKLFFKNVQNLVAKLKTTADSYSRESSLKELRTFLERIFAPTQKDCYQEIRALPPVDEIQVNQDKVTLVIYEPYTGGLHPDLQRFYDDLDYSGEDGLRLPRAPGFRLIHLEDAHAGGALLPEGLGYRKPWRIPCGSLSGAGPRLWGARVLDAPIRHQGQPDAPQKADGIWLPSSGRRWLWRLTDAPGPFCCV